MSTRLSMNTTFRPRPIDINRPLEIHRGILPTEADGCVRGVPSLPTGMEPEEEEEAHIQEAIAASLAFNVAVDIEIPTPICKVVEGYDTAANPNPYAPGTTYIFYRGDDIENTIEYDIDSEDEEFLNTLNASKKLLTEDKFEFAMDRFEKEVHFHPGQDISLPRAEAILKGAAGGGVRREVLAPLVEHWKGKRAAKDGNSLLSRFMKPPAFDDPSPYVAFRPREKDKEKFKKIRKNDSLSLAKMRALRQEMERSRTLLEMLKKREKLKKDQMTIVSQVFEQLLVELSVKSEDDGRPPKQKKIHRPPPPSVTSPVPSVPSPVEHIPKPKPTAPKHNRADYFYDIATVNTRLKIDPSQALPPYVLDRPKQPSSSSSSSRSSSSHTSSSPPSTIYPAFLQALARKRSAQQRSAWLLEDEDELSDYEDNDALLYEEENETEEDKSEDERVPDFAGEIAKLDENAFFPRRIDGYIATSRTATPFRGRARLGRGGRILFDRPLRFPSFPPPSSPPPPASPLPSSSSPIPPSTSPLPSTTSPFHTATSPVPSTSSSFASATSPLPSATSPFPSTTSPLPSSASPLPSSSLFSPLHDKTHKNTESNNNHNNSSTSLYNNSEDEQMEEVKEEKEDKEIAEKEERGGQNDVEMDNESDNEDLENSRLSQRSNSPVNSEPEARLHFSHRQSPTHHTPIQTSPKLFSSSSPPNTTVLPPTNHSSSSSSPSPSLSPPLSPSANSCKDKMPTVLHTYSKKPNSKKGNL